MLKQIFFIMAMPALAALTQEAFSIKRIREPGDSLDISITQEMDHASYNGLKWLKQKQKRDGSFAEKDKLKCTALALLAFASDGIDKNSRIISNATQWLICELKNNDTTNINAAAWSRAALRIGRATNKNRLPPHATLAFLKREQAATSGKTTPLCNELILSTDPDANKLNLKTKHVDEKNYYHDEITLEAIWLNSRSINRRGGILLNNKGNRINWRGVYAAKIIGAQKIDSRGGGYWKGNTEAEAICNTALSLMIFKEF